MYNWYTRDVMGQDSGLDPWDARTIEWTIPNPTPEYNFAKSPVVHRLDEFWHMKYDEDDEGRAGPQARCRRTDRARLEYEGNNPESPIHLPAPSYFPIMMSAGIPIGVLRDHLSHDSLGQSPDRCRCVGNSRRPHRLGYGAT